MRATHYDCQILSRVFIDSILYVGYGQAGRNSTHAISAGIGAAPADGLEGSAVDLLNSINDSEKEKVKSLLNGPCYWGWVCEDHPNQPWGHRGCGAAGELCKNPRCDKDPDSVFVLGQPGRRKRQLEKLHSTLKSSIRFSISSRVTVSIHFLRIEGRLIRTGCPTSG
jgi:hypothetical protein